MSDDLRAKAVGGAKWAVLTSYSHQAIGAVSNLTLAWLLDPNDWGLVGAAMVVISIVRSCGNFGVNYALVHWRGDINRAAPTGLTLLSAISVVAYVVVLLAAPFTGAYFRAPAVPLLTKVLALSLLLKPPSVVTEGTLRKEFRLRRIFAIEFFSHLLSTAAAIVVAALLPRADRYWALVVGGLGWQALQAVFSWSLANVRLRFGFDRQVARELVNYGKFFVASSILMVFYLSLDRLVLGRIDSTLALGLYGFASLWVSRLGLVTAQIFGGVSLPVYAKLQDDPARLRASFCRVLAYTALVAMALLTGLMMLVPEAVRLGLPDRYDLAVQTFQILSLYYIIRAIDNTSGQLFAAIGRPKYDMILNAANLGLMAVGMVPLVYYYGPAGAAFAVLFARILRLVLNVPFCTRVLECRAVALVDSVMPATKAAAAMAGVLWGVKALVARSGGTVGWLGLGGLVVLGAGVYVGVVYVLHRKLFSEVLGLMRDALIPKRKAKSHGKGQ